MGKFSGCILACDIDGTTMYNGVLPKCNIDAIERFKSEGGTVSIATGRTASALSPILDLYNGWGPSVVSNGSMIYAPKDGSVLYEATLEKSELECVTAALPVSDTVGIELHKGNDVFTVNETQETIDHQKYEAMKTKPFDFNMLKTVRPNKILYLYTDEEEQRQVNKAVKAIAKKSDFCDTLVILYGKERRYLEQMPKGVSKAKTLIKMAEILSVEKKNVFAIGDGFNDIEMLKVAAISACPDNAPQEVKEEADMVFCHAKDGAVAEFVDWLFKNF